jgi:hypothetical protein
MDLDASFETLWNSMPDFELPEPQPYCVYAQRFLAWATQLTTNVAQAPHIVFVNQAKILLVDKYFEWRHSVPRTHRNRLGSNGHVCIFQTFVDAYDQLRVVELSLTPPPLYLPAAPEPAQIAGIFIGDREDENKPNRNDDKDAVEEDSNGNG